MVTAFNMLQNNEPNVTELMTRAIELLVEIKGGKPATRYQACVIEALVKDEISEDTNESAVDILARVKILVDSNGRAREQSSNDAIIRPPKVREHRRKRRLPGS